METLTLLSLLAFIGSTVYTTLYSFSGAEISNDFLTVLTPLSAMIGLFWMVILSAQIGLIAMLYRGTEQHKSFIKSNIGLKLVAINFSMSIWTFSWSFKYFIISELALVSASIFTALSVIKLEKSPKENSDLKLWTCCMLPFKMMLAIMFSLDLWQNLLLALDYYVYIGDRANQPMGRGQANGSAIVVLLLLLALINLGMIFKRKDPLWAVLSTYLGLCLLLRPEGKTQSVQITLTASVILPAVVYLFSYYFDSPRVEVRLNSPTQ